MKTPIQELIDEMTYMLTEGELSIYALREQARKLLEKEKEVIMDAYNYGQQIPPFDYAEKYYNETFKTNDVK